MKNLKKVLALVLVAATLMGLAVSASAKDASDYKDYNEVAYKEAVDVMSNIGVFNGSNGSFNPKGILTREEAAKIVTYMLMGKEDADKLVSVVAPYSDVPASRWSAGSIAYCKNQGILAGVGSNKFDPAGKLTGLQFAKMLLVALGYSPKIEKLTGSDWAVNVARLCIDAGLDDNMSGVSLAAQMTREQACQMALNTLEADLVRYDNPGTEITLSDGSKVVIGNTPVEPVRAVGTENYNSADANSHDETYRQFVEKYFADLSKTDGETDAFGRPSAKWENDGDEIGMYSDTDAKFTFTKAQTEDDIKKALKGYKVNGKALTENTTNTTDDAVKELVQANGTPAAFDATSDNVALAIAKLTGDATGAGKGNGKSVEIYADKNKEITSIVTLEYAVDEIKSISEKKDGDYRKTTYTGVEFGSFGGKNTNTTDPDGDNFVVEEGKVAKGDIVMVLMLADETHLYPTEKVVGKQSAYNTGKQTITVSGTTYTVGTAVKDASAGYVAMADFENSDDDANYYLDLFGYVVKGDAIASQDYAVIDTIRWTTNSNELDEGGAAMARLIFTDGSTKTVTLNQMTSANAAGNGTVTVKFDKTASDAAEGAISNDADTKHTVSDDQAKNNAYKGLIVTYSEKSNGKYDLSNKTSADAVTVTGNLTGTSTDAVSVVTKGVPALHNDVAQRGDNDTVYIVKTKDGDDDVYKAYTGYKNVPTVKLEAVAANALTANVTWVVDSGAADYIFIDATAAKTGDTTDKNVLYVFDNANTTKVGTDGEIQLNNVMLNGEVLESIKVDSQTVMDAINANGLWEVELDDEDVVTSAKDAAPGDGSGDYVKVVYDDHTANQTDSVGGGVLVDFSDSKKTYAYNDSTKVYVIDDDELVDGGTMDDISDNDVLYIKVVDKDASNADAYTIATIYVVWKADTQA